MNALGWSIILAIGVFLVVGYNANAAVINDGVLRATSVITNFTIRTNQKLTFDDNNTTGIVYNGSTGRMSIDSPANIGDSLFVNSTGVTFSRLVELNGSITAIPFMVGCNVDGTGLLGTTVPNECYDWIEYPLPYSHTPANVTIAVGGALGSASALTINGKNRAGVWVKWACGNTLGICGYNASTYSVTP